MLVGPVRVELTNHYQRGRRVVRLLESVVYDGPDGPYPIDAGAETDWCSTPRLLWALCPPFDRWAEAALYHDDMFTNRPFSRAEIDRRYRDALREMGCGLIRSTVLYWGVRLQARWTNDL